MKAVDLAPADAFSKRQLADCYVRQDQLTRAAPLLRAAGLEGYARQYESVTGTPNEVHGPQRTRIPFTALNPGPTIEAAVNGVESGTFGLDTGAPLALTTETAKKAGLRAVSTSKGRNPQETFTIYHGIVDSLRMGDMELRNVPAVWHNAEMPHALGVGQPEGVIGTTVFYHFLATMDFANQALILRRKTAAQRQAFRVEAKRAGAERLPLWLADTHMPHTLGSVNGYGPGLVGLDTGVEGAIQVGTDEKTAELAGVRLDYGRPVTFAGADETYPFVAPVVSLGRAVSRNAYGVAVRKSGLDDRLGFEPIGNFSQEFFKTLAVAFDYVEMDLYITGG
ncbi:retropepsin-like aspartic protease [Actinomadura sp. NEAU-AAG7]|uniref:retropepsin-like aspartic protease n=1 Tax=Actinomadura sp. NEAU-AAG7 TaxID=2839640 RepID=UPI001BE4BA3C|nr:retropepsin-like aspartic protease [Actinomadura sp. NEAU-AAG7]MBT2212380.1 aspartyl protease family protein [Actinomadura sp. NEAU-AAG7]